jgi:hypothetical protein
VHETYSQGVRKAVGICIPTSGRPVPFLWAMALKALAPPANLHGLYFNEIGKPVDLARCRLASNALANNVRYVAMFDDDVLMPANVLDRFVFQMENHPEIDVITGVYCSKTDPPHPMIFKPLAGAGSYWDWKVGDLFEIEGCGAGCMMIRAEIFPKLKKPWFLTTDEVKRQGDTVLIEQWGEDIWFCKQVLEAGGRIFCDGSILCPHVETQTGQVFVLPADSKPYWNAALAPDPQIEIAKAAKIPGWMTLAELAWLARQAKAHQRIVEIGSYLGRSTRALADNTAGVVHAVDDWKGPRDEAIPDAERAELFAKFLANTAGLDGRLQVHRADHAAELGSWSSSVDMVFIDGSHDYEDVKRDIAFWQARAPEECLLSGHDFSPGWPGVMRAVTELVPGVRVHGGTSIWYAEN